VWFFLSGRGEMWRRQGDREAIVDVFPGVCLTIPLNMIMAWVLTLPAAIMLSGVLFWIFRHTF
jgi:phosphate/sulfate permease